MDEKTGVDPEVSSVQGRSVTFEDVMDETVSLLDSLGKAVVSTAQDVSQLMIIRTDAEVREQLDLLVDAGVFKNRRAGAQAMIQEGIAVKQPLFERIERTQVQIAALKGQLRSLVTAKVAE